MAEPSARTTSGLRGIDEAYELVQDRGGQADPFGSEALTSLLEYMEMWHSELVVIVAGYEAPMEGFLAENPGLKSRFAYSMSFNTYNAEEMWRILLGMAAAEGRSIDPAVEERFKQIIDVMWDTDQRGNRVLDVAGNGRFARNVFEQAQGLASRRLFSEDPQGLRPGQRGLSPVGAAGTQRGPFGGGASQVQCGNALSLLARSELSIPLR